MSISIGDLKGKPRLLLLALIASTAGLLSYLSFNTYVRPSLTIIPLENSLPNSPPHLPDNTQQTSGKNETNILLVSALFPLSKSKHTMRDYKKWLNLFLGSITTDVYFYTIPDLEPLVREARGNLPITINTTFLTPFDVPPLVDYEEAYREMRVYDREKYRHSVGLYAVWNSKPYLLDAAVKTSHKEYDYAFWNDAGSFRHPHLYIAWPDAERVEEIWSTGSELTGTKKEDLFFFPITGVPDPSMKYWIEDMGPIDSEMSQGSFFGGSPTAIDWWRRTYYAYHNAYSAQHFFVGKDQTLINAIITLFPSRIIAVWRADPNAPARVAGADDRQALGACGSPWFYYQFWFASPTERERMRYKWVNSWHWDFWRTPVECRVTQVLQMGDVLGRVFGSGWVSPTKTVEIGV